MMMAMTTMADDSTNQVTKSDNAIKALHDIDTLLHIFRYVDLRDCVRCRQVCRSWYLAVGKHFRIMPRLILRYKDISQTSYSDELSKNDKPSKKLVTLESQTMVTYGTFIQTLTTFPSVREVCLESYPINDIFLTILITLLPKLSKLHLISCWIHPCTTQDKGALIQSFTDFHYIFKRFCPDSSSADKQMKRWSNILVEFVDTTLAGEGLSSQLRQHIVRLSENANCLTRIPNQSESELKLSKSTFRLFAQVYSNLTHLTLANCDLKDDLVEIILRQLNSIVYLNLKENDDIEGRCLRYLSSTCETLCVGSYNVQVTIADLLAGIVRSQARFIRNMELTGCLSTNLHHLEQFQHLESLVLNFYSQPMTRQSVPFYSITTLKRLKTLTLQQEFCYEEQSVIENQLFRAILENCPELECLEILGEYGWELRLNDNSLFELAAKTPRLTRLAFTGDSKRITSKGIESLSQLTNLQSLSLSSFKCITDQSVSNLIAELKNLNNLCLRDNPSLTIKTLEACIATAYANPHRQLSVHLDEKQMSASRLLIKYATDYIKDVWQHSKINSCMPSTTGGRNEVPSGRHHYQQQQSHPHHYHRHRDSRRRAVSRWPTNLKVVMEQNLRSYTYDGDEMTTVKILSVMTVSVLIVLMLVTMLAVTIFLPLGLMLFLLHEKFVSYLVMLFFTS